MRAKDENFLNECGATMIEYMTIIALIAIVVITSTSALGWEIHDKFEEAGQALGGGIDPPLGG